MMVTDSLASQPELAAPSTIDRDQVIANAKRMVHEGAAIPEVIDYLVLNGAPPDQARDLAGRFASDLAAETEPKKKRGFFKR